MQENVLLVRDENELGKIHHTLQLKFNQATVSVRDIICLLYTSDAADE